MLATTTTPWSGDDWRTALVLTVFRVMRKVFATMPRIHTFGPQPAYDALRRERYTIALAARTMNVNENHLRAVLKGNTSPSPEVRARLPKLLNVGLAELFTPDALESIYDVSKNVWKPVAE